MKLEASIREVHSMFIDVNNLVQMQGEMVTRIEDYVNSKFNVTLQQLVDNIINSGAVIDVEKGRDDLGKAEKFKKAATKKKFICLALVVVIVIIILLGELATSMCQQCIENVFNDI